jgi:uncharacterized protein YndB with AHSA1/START domain
MNTDSTNTPADFELHLQFAVPGERLFNALATLDGTKGWWTKFSEGSVSVGEEASFRFPGGESFAAMKTLQRDAPRLLEWECVNSKHDKIMGHNELREWIGTQIRFVIRDLDNGKSQLDFTHFRLGQLGCSAVCSGGWSFFLNESLRGYLEMGKGQPWDKAE